MESDSAVRVVRRYLQLLEEGDVDALDEVIAENVVVLAPDGAVAFTDRDAWKRAQSGSPFTGERIVVEQLVSDGEQVAVRYSMTATHSGDAFGVPGDGSTITTSGTKVYTVRDGRIAQIAGHDDVLGLIRRLGGSVSG